MNVGSFFVILLGTGIVQLCICCPLTNITDQQLLIDNRPLRELFNRYAMRGHGSKINLDGIKNLITTLYIKTTCPTEGERGNFLDKALGKKKNLGGRYNDDVVRRRDYELERRRKGKKEKMVPSVTPPLSDDNNKPKSLLPKQITIDTTSTIAPKADENMQGDSPFSNNQERTGKNRKKGESKKNELDRSEYDDMNDYGERHDDHYNRNRFGNDRDLRHRVSSSDRHNYRTREEFQNRPVRDPYLEDPFRDNVFGPGDPFAQEDLFNRENPYKYGDPYKQDYRFDDNYNRKRYPNYRRGWRNRGYGNYLKDKIGLGPKNCETIEQVILNAGIVKEDTHLGPHDLLHLCPAIVQALLNPPCDSYKQNIRMMVSRNTGHGYDQRTHNHHHRHRDYDYEYEDEDYHMTRDSWIGAILSLILIGMIAMACILVIPVLKKSKYYIAINHFLLALAVGSLAGDALIHLLPHALTMEMTLEMNAHLAHALYGFTAFLGIMTFLLMERLHNIFGHKHTHSKAAPTPTPTPAATAGSPVEKDDLVKEIGVTELNETHPKHAAKIGKKLSQHSKTSSFTNMDAEPRGCFDNCPPTMEEANNGTDSIRKPRPPDRHSSTAERERLVAVNQEFKEKVSTTNKDIKPNPIPPPPLVQGTPKPPLIRQDSTNFNMVLQEYHIGHHGHSHHGHSHVTGKKDSLKTMILLGDGMHTFMDGMAIGAAFGTSLTGGIATAIAVLCHELPHKVGDFAILFEMGMKRNQAIRMVLLLWLLSFCGLAVGVSIGSIQAVSPWIYCFTAGVFLYLALVDLLSELSINEDENCSAAGQMALQVGGMMTGAIIMLIIAIYEHDLEELLEGRFYRDYYKDYLYEDY